MKQSQLLVYGDIALDIFMEAPDLPQRGGDVRVASLVTLPGGSAANCAAVAAQLGIRTRFLGNVGRDETGAMLARDLKNLGVKTSHLIRAAGDSGQTTSILTPDGERTFLSYRGVNAASLAKQVSLKNFKKAAIFHLTGYAFQDPGSRQSALQLIQLARSAGVGISLDPSYNFARDYAASPEKFLPDVRYFFPNQVEAQLLCGSNDPQKAARALVEMGPQWVVLKVGSEGCLLADRQQTIFSPGFPLDRCLDTTGAGDAFCAGFLAGQIWGLTPGESAVIANLSAANIVQKLGGHTNPLSPQVLHQKLLDFQYPEIANKLMDHNHMAPE